MGAAAAGIGSGLGSIAGGFINADASRDAANAQAGAANNAAALQYKMYEQQRQDQQPFRDAGTQALSQMSDPYFQKDFSMGDFQQDPGYQFRMQQGQQALERSAAAAGGLQNGGTLRALAEYGQNFASNEYNNAYNRFTNNQSNRFNRLSSVAQMGQGATNQMGAASQNYANQAGQNMMDVGAAHAAGTMGVANAWTGALSGIGKAGMDASAMNMQNNWMDRSLKARGA